MTLRTSKLDPTPLSEPRPAWLAACSSTSFPFAGLFCVTGRRAPGRVTWRSGFPSKPGPVTRCVVHRQAARLLSALDTPRGRERNIWRRCDSFAPEKYIATLLYTLWIRLKTLDLHTRQRTSATHDDWIIAHPICCFVVSPHRAGFPGVLVVSPGHSKVDNSICSPAHARRTCCRHQRAADGSHLEREGDRRSGHLRSTARCWRGLFSREVPNNKPFVRGGFKRGRLALPRHGPLPNSTAVRKALPHPGRSPPMRETCPRACWGPRRKRC